jgi:hypothetical protein
MSNLGQGNRNPNVSFMDFPTKAGDSTSISTGPGGTKIEKKADPETILKRYVDA